MFSFCFCFCFFLIGAPSISWVDCNKCSTWYFLLALIRSHRGQIQICLMIVFVSHIWSDYLKIKTTKTKTQIPNGACHDITKLCFPTCTIPPYSLSYYVLKKTKQMPYQRTLLLGWPKLWRWVNSTPIFFWYKLLSTTSGPQTFSKIRCLKVTYFHLPSKKNIPWVNFYAIIISYQKD